MGIFDLNKGQEQAKADGAPQEGEYTGSVTEAKISTTQAGHKQIVSKIKTSGGMVRHTLNLEHPAAKEIAHKELFKMLAYGYKNPPQTLESFEDVAQALIGVPVRIKVKHKGENEQGYMQYNVSFLDQDEAAKINFNASGTPF